MWHGRSPWLVLKMQDPQVTMDFNTKSWSNWLGWFGDIWGTPHDLGNLQKKESWICLRGTQKIKNMHYRFPSHGGFPIGKIKNHLKQTQGMESFPKFKISDQFQSCAPFFLDEPWWNSALVVSGAQGWLCRLVLSSVGEDWNHLEPKNGTI